jgi:hypothetical protein
VGNGARIRGHLQYEGAAEKPARTDGLTLGVEPVGGGSRALSTYGMFDATGQFVTTQIPPGRYFVRMNLPPRGWTVRSVSYRDRDISDVALDVGAEDIIDVVVTLSDHTADLNGTVRDDSGAVDTKAFVVVFPVDRAGWVDYGDHPRRVRSTQVTKVGAYVVANLPAGDYFVAALPGSEGAAWQAPSRLEVLTARATKVTIGANGSTRDLVTIKR